jgi:hypothetical protein
MLVSISIIYPKSNIWSATWSWWVEAIVLHHTHCLQLVFYGTSSIT